MDNQKRQMRVFMPLEWKDAADSKEVVQTEPVLFPNQEQVIHFVEVLPPSDPQSEAHRRRVRSLAMQNYHAKRRANSSTAVVEFKGSKAESSSAIVRRNNSETSVSAVPKIPRSSLDTYAFDPFFGIPIDPSSVPREVIHDAFTSKQPNVILFRETQFASSLHCGASFYAALANLGVITAAGTSGRHRDYHMNFEQQNMAKALQLVQIMLSDESKMTEEGLISAVASLVTHARLKNDKQNGELHRSALRRLVQLRGGIETLSEHVRGFVLWSDVNSAIAGDFKAHFAPPAVNIATPSRAPSSGAITLSRTMRRRFPEHEQLIISFEEISMYANIFDKEGFPSNDAEYSNQSPILKFYSSRCCRLLNAQQEPDFNNESSVFGEFLRLGLLIFMISLCRVVAPRTSKTDAQMAKLKLLIIKSCRMDWTDLQSFRAWIICLGYLEAEGVGDDVRWWRKLWKQCLDDFPTSGSDSILPSKLLVEMPREVSWAVEKAGPQGEKLEQRMFLDHLSRVILKIVSSIIWIDAVHGTRYRKLVGRKVSAA